jgi:hypothetical protein
MNKSNALSSYMAEMVDIMQEMTAKMQRVKEIKAEMDKLKQVETKINATKVTNTTTTNKITCECGCKINKSSWYTHIKTKKHEKLLNQAPKAEEIKDIKIIHDDDYENDDHDDEKTIDDKQVDKVLIQIKDRFYKGLYVRNYEHQNFLDISIRMAIHKHYDTYKDYKLIDREINNILNEHIETYPIKKNERTKSKDEILEQILMAKLWKGIPVNYCISDKDMKHFKRVILNDVYCEYADMMNMNKPMELVRDSYKLSVVKAFTEHKDKYGLDKDKIEEYMYMDKHM